MLKLVNAASSSKPPRAGRVYSTPLVLALLLASVAVAAANPSQQSFNSPDAAVSALIAATKGDDLKALNAIPGPAAGEILSSGDPVADNNARDNFVNRYKEMHRLAYDDKGRVILYIGADNWPMPIPLIKKDSGWLFDTASGKEELLYRRIGQNELYTIGVLEDLADAQQDYASQPRVGNSSTQFARKILSDPGKQNGLYWSAAPEEPQSPIGPLIASAASGGYKTGASDNATPFHGYFYKILTRQGKHAPGGTKNYLVNGKMIGGFAFLAYPADYRSSGVMTFMMNQDGIIVQKDIGPDTERIAKALVEFNPDGSWSQVLE